MTRETTIAALQRRIETLQERLRTLSHEAQATVKDPTPHRLAKLHEETGAPGIAAVEPDGVAIGLHEERPANERVYRARASVTIDTVIRAESEEEAREFIETDPSWLHDVVQIGHYQVEDADAEMRLVEIREITTAAELPPSWNTGWSLKGICPWGPFQIEGSPDILEALAEARIHDAVARGASEEEITAAAHDPTAPRFPISTDINPA
jgi:hypothetical protein